MWEESFVAMSVMLGSSVEEAGAALDERQQKAARRVMSALGDPSRGARAKALAMELARILQAAEGQVLA